MKTIQIILLLAIPVMGFSQNSATSAIDKRIEREVIALKQDLAKREYLTDYEKAMTMKIAVDTFRIEKMITYRIDEDNSTQGMVDALYEAEEGYDKLLNKYYTILMQKLNDEDKQAFRQSQRTWLAFRDAERTINTSLAKDEYSGGGTIQRLTVASQYLTITKRRVFDLFDYLERMIGED